MPLLIAIVANVALYAFAVYPLRRQVATAEAEAEARRRATARLIARAGDRDRQGQADDELKKFYKDMLAARSNGARARTLRLARLAHRRRWSNAQSRGRPRSSAIAGSHVCE